MATLNDRYVREALQQLVTATSTTNAVTDEIQPIVNISARNLPATIPQRRDVKVLLSEFQPAGNATTTHYTVPAGRVFYLCSSVNFQAAAASSDIKIFDADGATVLYRVSALTAAGVAINNFSIPIKLSAGQMLKSVTGVGANVSINLYGWEEDAA